MISVTILVKNGERHLKKVLTALRAFKEIIIYDTGSEDQSLAIAKQFSNVHIFEKPFTGFGNCHNQAASLATYDWILSIDADEVITPELAQEILCQPLMPEYAYSLPFKNFFNGKHIRSCGWHPESHIRLYNKKRTSFSETLVHEGVVITGLTVVPMKNSVHHYSYVSINDFLEKMQRYTSLFALQNKGKKKSTPFTAFYHGLWAFLRSYFLKRGFLAGYEGFLISFYQAETAFYKYLKLYELNVSGSSLSSNRKREIRKYSRDDAFPLDVP